MNHKSLILYESMTGNTEKVAMRFKKVFEKKGWQCDIFKVDKKMNAENLPFDFRNYDFLCVGSPVVKNAVCDGIKNILFYTSHHRHDDPSPPGPLVAPSKKLTLGPQKGIAFVTYAGMHLGPKEAEPALAALELEMEHLRFQCIGRFSCPGKMGNKDTPEWWHGDIRNRPNERDLLKAEIFLEERIEELD